MLPSQSEISQSTGAALPQFFQEVQEYLLVDDFGVVQNELLEAVVLDSWRFLDAVSLKRFLEFHFWGRWSDYVYELMHRLNSDGILNVVKRLKFGFPAAQVLEQCSQLVICKIVLGEQYFVEDETIFDSLFQELCKRRL